MSYVLGVDISGTHLFVARSSFEGWTWSPPEPVRLGTHAYAVPAVLHVAADGAVTVGDQVTEGPMVDGRRIARGFVQRMGDDVSQVVAGEPCLPHKLTAVLVGWAVERVQAQTGQGPEHLVISHPAAWGHHRQAVLRQALWDVGLGEVTLLPAPVAAATAHAWDEFTGHTLAVITMCGNGFETAAVCRSPAEFSMLGCREGVDPLGGEDFDEALAELVRARLGREFGRRYLRDPQIQLALMDLAAECGRARPTLTAAAETEVMVRLPAGLTAVPVSRAEFDDAVRPLLRLVVDTLLRTVRGAGLQPDRLDGVLLAAAASQLPLLTEMIGEELAGGVPVHARPQPVAAMGAALVAQRIVSAAGSARYDDDLRRPANDHDPDGYPPAPASQLFDDPAPPRPPVRITSLMLPRRRSTAMLVPSRDRAAAGWPS